jgi:hypothetical protein
MTISKPPTPKPSIYNPDNDPPPPELISIGVSLITREVHSFIQDDRHIEIPVDDAIAYLTVERALIEVPSTSSIKYDVIADLLDTEGYRKSHWQIVHCWECIPDPIANEIF